MTGIAFVLPLWGNGSESAPKGFTGVMIPLGLMAGVMVFGGCWLALRMTKRVRADIREGRVIAFEGPLVKRIDKDTEGGDIYPSPGRWVLSQRAPTRFPSHS